MANNEDLFKHLNSVPTSGSIIHFFPNSVPGESRRHNHRDLLLNEIGIIRMCASVSCILIL